MIIQCSNCHAKIRASDSLAGKVRACPQCGTELGIPPPSRKTSKPVWILCASFAVVATGTVFALLSESELHEDGNKAEPQTAGATGSDDHNRCKYFGNELSEVCHRSFVAESRTVGGVFGVRRLLQMTRNCSFVNQTKDTPTSAS